MILIPYMYNDTINQAINNEYFLVAVFICLYLIRVKLGQKHGMKHSNKYNFTVKMSLNLNKLRLNVMIIKHIHRNKQFSMFHSQQLYVERQIRITRYLRG